MIGTRAQLRDCYLMMTFHSMVTPLLVGDALIALVFFYLPVLLTLYVRRRPDLPVRGLFYGISTFLFLNGLHFTLRLLEEWFETGPEIIFVQYLTAATAAWVIYTLHRRLPRLLTMPTQGQYHLQLGETTRALEQLQQSEQQLRFFMQSAPVGMAVVDPAGDYLEVNQALCDILGCKREELLSMNFRQLVTPEQLEEDREAMEALAIGEVKEFSRERLFLRRNGEPVWIQMYSTVVRDNQGAVTSYLMQVTDITDKKVREQRLEADRFELEQAVEERTRELERINRDLESFVYAISHDLRQPLRHIQGFADMLEENIEPYAQTDPESRRLLGIIRGSAERMAQMMTDLLSFTRTRAYDLVKTRIDMNAIVESVLAEQQQLYADHTLELCVQTLPPAFGDQTALRQVWHNLIGNALKYSSKRDIIVIRIEGRVEKNSVVYSIADNGVGFNSALQRRLFKLFQRLHHEEDFSGTGVGLAIVESILQKHGGEVWASSEIDRGATFCFRLPWPEGERVTGGGEDKRKGGRGQ